MDPSPAAGRRRYLTVLFADLSDSTRLGGEMEAEHYADLLGALRTLCRSIIPRHGGRIARIQGDGVLAIFGYPQAREDDGRRATEAALDLHAAVSELALPGSARHAGSLAMHSGIHAGLVLLSDGDVERGRFELLGNVPNTAARLSDCAERSEIIVSEETLGPQSHFFATRGPQALTIKGRSLPINVLQVLGRADVRNRFEARSLGGLALFVGRCAEVQRLQQHFRHTQGSHGACLLVLAGPGMGKSRLLDESLRGLDASELRVLRGYCESYLSAEPLQPFRQILRQLFGVQPAMSAAEAREAAAQALRGLPALDDGTRAALWRIMAIEAASDPARGPAPGEERQALCTLMEALAQRQPLILVLDDWQWADDLSAQVLDAIRALRAPIGVLLASRPGGAEFLAADGRLQTMELPPLSLDDARRAIGSLLPSADPLVAAEIHQYAGGNPLFIEELCHSQRDAAPNADPRQRQGSSAWLHALIESRVARLAPAQAELVRTAAVLGNVFAAWQLERLTGLGLNDPLVQALAQQDLIYPAEQPGMLRFKHGITRDVIYEAVGLHERRALHLRIAQALESADAEHGSEEAHEALAYHCAAGGLPGAAAEYAERAGDKALAAFALDRARTQYAAALASLDTLEPLQKAQGLQWCGIAQKLGMASVFDPLSLADGAALFERGVARARDSDDPIVLARALYWLAYICYAKGQASTAIEHASAALGLAQAAGDDRLAAQVRATLGQTYVSAGRYEEALPLLDSAIDSKRARAKPGGNIAVGSAYSLACKGGVLGDRGDFKAAHACFDEALFLLGETEHLVASSVRNWVALVYLWQGRWVEAETMAAESVRVAERGKSRQLLAISRAMWGYSRWSACGEAEALQSVRDATAWIEARQGGLVTSLNHGWLVDSAVVLGDTGEARHHAAKLFKRARQQDRLGEAMGCRALARAASLRGDTARARAYLARAEAAAQARGAVHQQGVNRLCQAEMACAQGQWAQARDGLDQACAVFEPLQMAWHLAQAAQVRARL